LLTVKKVKKINKTAKLLNDNFVPGKTAKNRYIMIKKFLQFMTAFNIKIKIVTKR